MRFVSIPVLCMAVMTFYVGFYHLFLYYRRRSQHPEDFSFAIVCFTMGFYDVMCAGAYNANSFLDGFSWQRGQVAMASLSGVTYTWFITDYVPSKTKTIRNVFMVFFVVSALLVAFVQAPFFWHAEQTAVKHAHLPFNFSITYYEVTCGFYTKFLGAMGFVVFAYAYALGFRLYRENKAKGIPLLISNTVFCAGMINDALYLDLVIKSVYIIEYTYMAIVLLMAYSLSNTVVESAVLKEAFEASEKKYRSLVDNSLVGIFISLEGAVKFCNQRFAQIFGYSRAADVLGKPLEQLILPANDSNHAHASGAGGDEELIHRDIFEREGVTASETPIDLEIRANPINYESHAAVQGSVIDITDRKRADRLIRKERDKAQKYLDVAGVMMLVLGNDGVVQLINKKGCEILQYEEKEIIGKDWFTHFVPKPYRAKLKQDFTQMMAGESQHLQYHENPILTKDEDYRTIAWYNTILTDETGCIIGSLSSGEDITQRKAAEEQIQRNLKEKEILLKEIHHRVKNNLQIIISLLNLESARIGNERILRIFEDCNQRIRTMSMIHERLYQSEHFESIDFRDYVETLVSELFISYHVGTQIRSKLEIEPVDLGLDRAIPCGLILNELVTNAIKHAFPDNREGWIRIQFRVLEDKRYKLTVADNGIGVPDDFRYQEINTLGLKLVEVLTQQLDGTFEIRQNNGSTFSVTFKC
jgi:PAS domain S-box-containing protein